MSRIMQSSLPLLDFPSNLDQDGQAFTESSGLVALGHGIAQEILFWVIMQYGKVFLVFDVEMNGLDRYERKL